MPKAKKDNRSASSVGNPRRILAVGGVLASAVLTAGTGTAQAEPAPSVMTPTVTGTAAPTTAPPAGARDAERAAKVAINAAGGITALSVNRGPSGGHLTRVLLPSGDHAYVIEDATFIVRSIRVDTSPKSAR
ncbi:hypothetical protein [Leekyejoonella antrihumi]|uniref:PepSY domain-containing protein n=1 Tax=Leekyejoonella antrihumi TaxID=1660198 RepID=A0A563E9Y8_9MICO|nr:hypothetical protein [Leekyejoonella antrihumi]TWP38604.1 hypothetical protein FGL98_02120 [Leekyejoonella antrihumi]